MRACKTERTSPTPLLWAARGEIGGCATSGSMKEKKKRKKNRVGESSIQSQFIPHSDGNGGSQAAVLTFPSATAQHYTQSLPWPSLHPGIFSTLCVLSIFSIHL